MNAVTSHGCCARSTERLALRLLTAADALGNRWYGWRFNPLYQSGTIVVALYLSLLVTGLWLLLFYRVGAPWESVAGLTANLVARQLGARPAPLRQRRGRRGDRRPRVPDVRAGAQLGRAHAGLGHAACLLLLLLFSAAGPAT